MRRGRGRGLRAGRRRSRMGEKERDRVVRNGVQRAWDTVKPKGENGGKGGAEEKSMVMS